ncbi:hypothetical protein [Pedobacter sp. BMA]|uniref:hypothetical protein n=1 Tax=Pedobacter sp. BMA TaxID=1663685 RepID=UPI00064A63C4|nr:hypothetical protein [Pedobacter sp. BMA]KLT66128.1 hypothetical protein AB669_08160 [Pedobacter sp. BMA]
MKTSVYNKDEHLEGYVNNGKRDEAKSDVQKAYETGNDSDEVNSFGKDPSQLIEGNKAARDGYDNSGTQGKDSLSDDAYNSEDQHPTVESAESHTGSSSDDFKNPTTKINEQDENHALDTGI